MNFKKPLIYIVILLVFSASGYYVYKHSTEIGLTKPALIMKISTNETTVGLPMVNNVTFEQSSVMFFYKTTDTKVEFPEIDVNARLNKLDAAPASFWASTPYEKEGVYTLNVYFRDGNAPKQGDILILPIRIVGHTGAILDKKTAFYVWE